METSTSPLPAATPFEIFKAVCAAAHVPAGEAPIGVFLRLPKPLQLEILSELSHRGDTRADEPETLHPDEEGRG